MPAITRARSSGSLTGGKANSPWTPPRSPVVPGPLVLLPDEIIRLHILPRLKGDDDEAGGLVTLLQTCNKFMQLVLSYVPRVVFRQWGNISEKQGGVRGIARRLSFAHRYGKSVSLALADTTVPCWDCNFADVLRTAAQLLGQQHLTKIESVTLSYMELDSLVPRWLSDLCPNISMLTLSGCKMVKGPRKAPRRKTDPPRFAHLKTLMLEFDWAEQNHVEAKKIILDSLKEMKALETLALPSNSNTRLVYSISETVGPQIKQLLVEIPEYNGQLLQWLSMCRAVKCFPNVEDVNLGDFVTDHHDIHCLLEAPKLKRVSLGGVEVETNMLDKPCRWTHLSLMQGLNVASLGKLALDSLIELQLSPDTSKGDDYHVYLSPDPAENLRVGAVLDRTYGIRYTSPDQMRVGDSDEELPPATINLWCPDGGERLREQDILAVWRGVVADPLNRETVYLQLWELPLTVSLWRALMQPLVARQQKYAWDVTISYLQTREPDKLWPVLLSTVGTIPLRVELAREEDSAPTERQLQAMLEGAVEGAEVHITHNPDQTLPKPAQDRLKKLAQKKGVQFCLFDLGY